MLFIAPPHEGAKYNGYRIANSKAVNLGCFDIILLVTRH